MLLKYFLPIAIFIRCAPGWSGPACDCKVYHFKADILILIFEYMYILLLTLNQEDESNCVDPATGLICAGHGQCVCGVRLPSNFLI